jgi:TATA-box binding protein (TBP) (component of TFIID and TFIIIB)
MDLISLEREMFLCTTDEDECPRVHDLVLGKSVLPLPILTNFVVVASPNISGEQMPSELPLEQIAQRPGFDINNRRFAAVKVTVGASKLSNPSDVWPDDACERFCADNFVRGLADTKLASELSEPDESLCVSGAACNSTATCLFFASGNMVCTGASNPYAAMRAVYMTAALIRQSVPGYRNPTCQIENIVASVQMYPLLQSMSESDTGSDPSAKRKKTGAAIKRSVSSTDVPGELNLCKIAKYFELGASYEPELFPGAIFRPTTGEDGADGKDSMCFLLFPSGQCVITGAKRTASVYTKFRDFYIDITRCILDCSDTSCAYVPASIKVEIRRLGPRKCDATGAQPFTC